MLLEATRDVLPDVDGAYICYTVLLLTSFAIYCKKSPIQGLQQFGAVLDQSRFVVGFILIIYFIH